MIEYCLDNVRLRPCIVSHFVLILIENQPMVPWKLALAENGLNCFEKSVLPNRSIYEKTQFTNTGLLHGSPGKE